MGRTSLTDLGVTNLANIGLISIDGQKNDISTLSQL